MANSRFGLAGDVDQRFAQNDELLQSPLDIAQNANVSAVNRMLWSYKHPGKLELEKVPCIVHRYNITIELSKFFVCDRQGEYQVTAESDENIPFQVATERQLV